MPAGPPPLLADYIDSDDEGEPDDRRRKIRFNEVDDEPKADKSQDVDAYMQEMEEVHRQAEKERQARLEQQQPPMPHPVGIPRPPLMAYRAAPPPLRPGIAPPGVRLPPGPPPGRPAGMRMPPGPPPGVPPPRMGGPRMGMRPPGVGGVVSAGPQLFSKDNAKKPTVIQAKPQMRNLMSDVTRFVPTNVKVRREDGLKRKPDQAVFVKPTQPSQPIPRQGKDDAYAQFMKEMEQIMK